MSTPSAKVTNSSGVELAVLNAYEPDSSSSATIFQEELTLLETSDNKEIIADGSTVDVTMSPAEGQVIFDLLFVAPLNLYPALNQSFATFDPSTITVSSDDRSAQNNAFDFIQVISAYPTSNLAQNYVKACQDATTKESSRTITGTVDDFFKGTKNYQNVTNVMVATGNSYLDTFAFAWAGNQSSYTYYLYAPGGSGATNDKAAPKEMGTVVFTKKSDPPLPADPKDQNADYDIVYKDASGNTTSLYFDNSQLVSDLDADVPSICLATSFIAKSQMTGQTTDNQIIPIVSGTLNGVQIMGTTVKQDGSSPHSAWYNFFHPKSFLQGLANFAMAVGVLMAIEWVGEKVYKFGKWALGGKSKSEMKKFLDELDAKQKEFYDKLADRFGPDGGVNVPDPKDLQATVDDLKAKLKTSYEEQQRGMMEDAIDAQLEQVETLAEYSDTPELNDIASKLVEAKENLQKAGPGELDQAIKDAQSAVNDAKPELNDIYDQVSSELSAEAQDRIEKSREAIQEAEETNQELEEQKEELDNGEADEDIHDFPLDE